MASKGYSSNFDMGTADIQLKMCKKVAQLTKVIYVLNTRLDENDSMVAQLRSDHNKELELVRMETADKLRLYKNIVDQLAASERKNSELDETLQLQKRQEIEAIGRFEAFKKEAAERERNLREGYSTRVLELGGEVLKIKHRLEEKIAEVEKLAVERSSDKDKLNSAEEIEKRYKEEIGKLRERNHQLQSSIDKMRDDCQIMIDEGKRKFEESEQVLKGEITKLENELAKKGEFSSEEANQLRAEMENDFKRQLSMKNSDIEQLNTRLSDLENQNKIRVDDLLQRLASSDGQVDELKSEIQRLTQLLNSQSSDSNSLQKQLMEASSRTNEMIEENRKLEDEIAKINRKCSELSGELTKRQEQLSTSESSRLHLESLSSDMRRELEAAKLALEKAQNQISQSNLSVNEIETKMRAKISDLEGEISQQRKENSKLQNEIQKQRQAMTDEHGRKVQDIKASHENEMLVLKSRHEEELSRERLAGEEKLGKLSRELMGASDSLRDQFEAEKRLLKSNLEQEIGDLKQGLKEKTESLNKLEESTKTLTSQLESMKKQQETAMNEAKEAVWQLAESKRKVASLEEHSKLIEKENDEMKLNHPVEIENLATRLRMEKDNAVKELEAKWNEKLRLELSTVRRAMLGESEQKFQNSIDELQKQKELELAAVTDGWQKKTNELLKEVSAVVTRFIIHLLASTTTNKDHHPHFSFTHPSPPPHAPLF